MVRQCNVIGRCKDNGCNVDGGNGNSDSGFCLFNVHQDLFLLGGIRDEGSCAQQCFGSLNNVFLTTTMRDPLPKLFSWMMYT